MSHCFFFKYLHVTLVIIYRIYLGVLVCLKKVWETPLAPITCVFLQFCILHTHQSSSCFFFIAGSIPTWGYSSRNNWTYLDILYNSIYRIISQLVGVGILLLYHVISICNSLNPTNIHDVMTNPQYSWFISTSIPYIYPQLFTRVDFKSHLYIYMYLYLYIFSLYPVIIH